MIRVNQIMQAGTEVVRVKRLDGDTAVVRKVRPTGCPSVPWAEIGVPWPVALSVLAKIPNGKASRGTS